MAASNEEKIEALIKEMTLQEKIMQLAQERQPSDEMVRSGLGSGILAGSATAGNDEAFRIPMEENNRLQKIAVEESRLGIPLIFGRDVIHGHHTVYPIPLGQAVETAYEFTAAEGKAEGVHWTFTPMLDIGRDPRWGRVAEGFGEDLWLCSRLAEASIRGIQGDDPAAPDRMLACAKHFVAYGACDGGRDYDTVSIGRRLLNDVYLPSFEAAVKAGVATIMASFNELDGIPVHAHRELLTHVLRDEWGFDGFVVSDWNGVLEIFMHGAAVSHKEAAKRALLAGVDMDMVCGLYREHLETLVEEGEIQMSDIDTAVRRILRMKMLAGLFDNPYADIARAKASMLKPAALEHATECARMATIMLKNENGLLPLETKFNKIGVFGPLAHAKKELFGTWTLDGDERAVTTVANAMEKNAPEGVTIATAPPYAYDLQGLLPRQNDVNVVILGEHPLRSGEANSVADIGLPPGQLELLKQVHAQRKPVVAVIVAGRALALQEVLPFADAILFVFHPGTQGGEALSKIIYGELEPGGRLPVSIPRVTGQVPIYYNRKNTGRPHPPVEQSRYADIPDNALFTFGYGMGYSTYSYSDLRLASDTISTDGTLKATAKITNTGDRDGETVAELYVHHIAADVSRPVRELKAFERVFIKAGESVDVTLTVNATDLKYTNAAYEQVIGTGDYDIWLGQCGAARLQGQFKVI